MKNPKPKKAPYLFIDPQSDEGKPIYARLQLILDEFYPDVAGARFAITWNLSWRPDAESRPMYGQLTKVGALDREVFDRFDFILVLSRERWYDPLITDEIRDSILDDECAHAGVQYDAHGKPCEDERGRRVYVWKDYDVRGFSAVIERRGCYRKDLEALAKAIDKARQRADDTWVGFTALRGELREAGLDVPLEAIVGWSEAERREARTWLALRAECLPQMWQQVRPGFLVSADDAAAH